MNDEYNEPLPLDEQLKKKVFGDVATSSTANPPDIQFYAPPQLTNLSREENIRFLSQSLRGRATKTAFGNATGFRPLTPEDACRIHEFKPFPREDIPRIVEKILKEMRPQ